MQAGVKQGHRKKDHDAPIDADYRQKREASNNQDRLLNFALTAIATFPRPIPSRSRAYRNPIRHGTGNA
jgi:hypothetical protein